ncbi:MAG TPA: UDP-N-acetylmuramoyl-L-alanine--D-glutamate ligase [Gemmatimonadales bacterium]|nr:UDP-N-acetylmuramoyl-L-alanine--D-glutamate ligase [Gemmatimonadales bacterium]
MTLPDGWRDGTVAVVGLGKSGVAATRLLAREGARVYASDAATSPPGSAAVELLRALPGVEVELGRHDLAKIRAAKGVVVSPGVPPDAAPLSVARSSGVPVLSELDLGWRALPGMRCIAVTGTNGKTTTTALVSQLLRTAGLDALAAGNIGLPLADVALAEMRPQWLAVEVSSFQLHDSPDFAPEIGVLTNLAPDHLDRYSDVAAYYADKRLMYRNATDDNVWVVNGDDAASLDLVRGIRGRHVRFSVAGPADAWYDGRARSLMLGGSALLPRDALALLGLHNVANALAAALAVHEAGIAPGAIAEGLRSFRALHHRLETVAEAGGVRWINDSKATNVSSTAVAIEAMDRPFVLLLGGRHKGEPYTRLGPLLQAQCRLVIAYGEAGPRIEADLEGVVPLERGGDFADVMRRARAAARPGYAVLLSPACSSYDMFKNYEERGAAFERLATAA